LVTKFIAKPNRSDVPLSLSIFQRRVFHYLAVVRKAERKPFAEFEVSDVVAGTIEGHTTYVIAPIPITLPQIRDGKLLPLGVTTARRSTLLPQVPTIAEAGVAGFDFPIWYGIWVPAGTPTGVVDKLSRDIRRVVAGPDLRDWITKHGGEPMRMTQPEFARFVQGESESAARLLNNVGIKPQ
jgi:tripartite-type tricarboxylate transporter receptor subunit TctC